jgi:hypothetical protein
MDLEQLIHHLLAGQEEMKADVKAWQEMKERGEAEGKAYTEKMLAKWKGYREEVATRRETIHNKINDKLCADWTKLDSNLKKRKADMLKAYEEKRMAEQKADQERREACEKMMAEWEADQERRKAERKACEKKMMAKWEADQERRKAERKGCEEKMMAERKLDQVKRDAKTKVHQEDLQKMMNAKINAETDAI